MELNWTKIDLNNAELVEFHNESLPVLNKNALVKYKYIWANIFICLALIRIGMKYSCSFKFARLKSYPRPQTQNL